jgi:hypothetical protein
MAFAMLYEFPDMTQEHYDRLLAETYEDGAMAGVTAHAAGPIEGGGWWAFDVYESQAAADAIGPPAIEKLQAMGAGAPSSIRTLQVHNSRP